MSAPEAISQLAAFQPLDELVVPPNSLLTLANLDGVTLPSLIRAEAEEPHRISADHLTRLKQADPESTLLDICAAAGQEAFMRASQSPFQWVERVALRIEGEDGFLLGNTSEFNSLFIAEATRKVFCKLFEGRSVQVYFAYGVYNGTEFKGDSTSLAGTIRGEPTAVEIETHPWLSAVEFESAESPDVTVREFLKSEPLTVPKVPARVTASSDAFTRFASDVSNDLDSSQWQSLIDAAGDQHEALREHFRQHEQNLGLLENIGEAEIPYVDNPLRGQPAELPEPLVRRALALRLGYMALLNHPVRLAAQMAMEERGYQPIGAKAISVLEERRGQALAYNQLARAVAPTPEEVGADQDQRTKLFLALGSLSFVNDQFTANYLCGSSMTEYSAFATATMALSGSVSYFPRDGKWNDPEARMDYARRVAELINFDPFLGCGLFLDDADQYGGVSRSEYLKQRAFRCVGPTVKPFDPDAVDEVKRMRDLGFRAVRIYDPRATTGMMATLEMLRKVSDLDDMVISVGMDVDSITGKNLRDAGANSLIVGIGSGAICETPTAADIHGRNVQTIYDLNHDGVGIPVMAEGGVGPKLGVLMAVGGAGNHASGKIMGGTVEQAPVLFWRLTPDGRYQAKGYKGEASSAIKKWGGNTDAFGAACNVEGVFGFEPYVHRFPTIPMRIWKLMEGMAKSALMRRETHIEALTHQVNPKLLFVDQEGSAEAQTHGPGRRNGNSVSIAEWNRRTLGEMQNWGVNLRAGSERVHHPPLAEVF